MAKTTSHKSKQQPFQDRQYATLSLTDLVLYALFSLHSKGTEGTFGNLVAESYELFPKKFSLQGYPEYPDSWRVGREIQRVSGTLPSERTVGLVRGNIKTNFELTEKGLCRLKEIQRKLETGTADRSKIDRMMSDKRGKIGRVINHVEGHVLFSRFHQEGEKTDVPEHLLRDLLFATLETSNESLREKMEILVGYSEDVQRNDILDFLVFCRRKHPKIFFQDDMLLE